MAGAHARRAKGTALVRVGLFLRTRRMTLEHIAVACGLANVYLTVRQNIW
jgi:hypothetical protein